MGRLLIFLLALAVLGYAAYTYVSSRPAAAPPPPLPAAEAPSAPKQTLDSAREAAKRIEEDAQRRADELMEKTK